MFRFTSESGQASGLHGADPGRRESSFQSSEDPQRYAQIWSHLPRLPSGTDHCQEQGQSMFRRTEGGINDDWSPSRIKKHWTVLSPPLQISRMLAAKASLAIRYDALGEDTNAEMGIENRAKLEARLRQLEDRGVRKRFQEFLPLRFYILKVRFFFLILFLVAAAFSFSKIDAFAAGLSP